MACPASRSRLNPSNHDPTKQNHKSIFPKTGHNVSSDKHVDKRSTSIKLLPLKRKLEKEFKKQNIKRIWFSFKISFSNSFPIFSYKKNLPLPVLKNFIYYFILEVFEKVPDCRGCVRVRGHERSLRPQDGVWIFRASYHVFQNKKQKRNSKYEFHKFCCFFYFYVWKFSITEFTVEKQRHSWFLVFGEVMNYFDEAELKKQRKMEWGKHWIAKGFQALEKHLEENSR